MILKMCEHLNIFPKGTLTAKRPGFKCEHVSFETVLFKLGVTAPCGVT